MSVRRLGPVAAKILLAVAEGGEKVWRDLSWARPLSDAQVYGAVSHSLRLGLLDRVGDGVFVLTDAGRSALEAKRAAETAEAAKAVAVDAALTVLRAASMPDRLAAMVAAREAGATFAEIGAAAGMTRQGAADALRRRCGRGAPLNGA